MCVIQGGTTHSGIYKDASPERGTLFGLEVVKREGISKVEEQKIVRKIASWVLKRGFKIIYLIRRKVTCEGVTVDSFNHLSPNSDQHRFSPNNINT